MPPTVANQQQIDAMNDLYYTQAYQYGVIKFYKKLKVDLPQLNITRNMVQIWLREQPTHQINSQQKKTVHMQPNLSKKPVVKLQCDLIDYINKPAFGNLKYVLVVIDIFSKYVWVRPFVNKTSLLCRNAFEHIYNQIIARPTYNTIQVMNTDNGSEFKREFHDFLVNHNIRQTTGIAKVPESNAVVERANRTIKTQVARKVKTLGGNWNTHLDDVVNEYNNSYHTALRDTPNNVINNYTPADIRELARFLKKSNRDTRAKRFAGIPESNLEVLNLGDRVRIKIMKKPLEKYYINNWSENVYIVDGTRRSRKRFTIPRFYLLDTNGNRLDKTYPRNDLQKIP